MTKGIRLNVIMKFRFAGILILFINAFSISSFAVVTGAQQTEKYLPLIKGKKVALVANHTSLIGSTHLVDTLLRLNISLQCIFAPEHGFRGQAGAGEKVKSGIDQKTGIKVISLYGKHLKPTKEDLAGIETVIFDIQDVGVRFYTYISTLQYVMEACAEQNIPLIILDRPNPNAYTVDGPVLEKKFSSFVGMQRVPVMYGMTIGEYALMLNGEKWLRSKPCLLKVIALKDYDHQTKYELPIAPSPNLRNMDAIYLYPSICFFEGTRVSLGRGTDKPFQLIGYPGMKNGSRKFKPENIEGVVTNPPYKDTLCNGLDLTGKGDSIRFRKQGLELKWLLETYRSFPDTARFFDPFFDKLAGTDKLRNDIRSGKSEAAIRSGWKKGIASFQRIRKKYLIYD